MRPLSCLYSTLQYMAAADGVEPSFSGSEPDALPMYYAALLLFCLRRADCQIMPGEADGHIEVHSHASFRVSGP